MSSHNKVDILSDLVVKGAIVLDENYEDFPENASLGTLLIKGQNLYGYLAIGGLETWYPFDKQTKFYIHTQGLAASQWVVEHNFGTDDVWYSVKDANGQIISVGRTPIDENSFRLNFTSATVGTVIVVAPSDIDVNIVRTSILKVGGGDEVIIDSSGVRVLGEYVLTDGNIQEIVDSSIDAAVEAKADTTYVDSEISTLETSIGTKADTTYVDSEISTLETSIGTKADIESPSFTGTVSAENLYHGGTVTSKITEVAALNVDCSLGKYFTKTVSTNSEFTFSNVPSSVAYAMTVRVNHQSGTITFPSGVRWVNDVAPTMTAGKIHLFMFLTENGGTTWRAAALTNYAD